jgi:hypothetical protein
MKHVHKRLTYANVMSSIAVFLVLGGATAFAASKIGANQLKANSVKTGKIVKEAITTSKIKNSAVSGVKVLDGSLTAVDLAAGTLTPACPSGTLSLAGRCIEASPRPAAPYNSATETCTAAGGELPRVTELIGFTKKVQAIPAQEWSGDLFSTTTGFAINPDGTPAAVALTAALPFRCVGAPTP